MITILMIISITINSIYTQNICSKICENNDLCIKKCGEYEKNPNRNRMSAPNCGLSRLDLSQTEYEFKDVKTRSMATDQKLKWPWIASLQYQKTRPSQQKLRPHFCTGVIINENFILSSAQCVPKEVGAYQVMIGSNSLSYDDQSAQIIEIESVDVPGILYKSWVKKHENFGQKFNTNDDILLIKTATKMEPKLKGNEFVINSICLPETNMNVDLHSDQRFGRAVIAGWGYQGIERTPISTFMEVDNPLISNEEANQLFKERRHYFGNEGQYFIYNYTVTKQDLVTMANIVPGADQVPRYTFNGDSGSSLVKTLNGRAFTLGVSHWISKGVNPISVWAKTSYYNKWLEENMKKTIWKI